MLLKLLLHYLYWKTFIPYVVFLKFCVKGNMVFLYRSEKSFHYNQLVLYHSKILETSLCKFSILNVYLIS